ncbi:MAG: hypothetical protein NTY22_07655 [Proteobacteria bacterium]|nr:hypothetical protein [Pseudomonadota bacterium]
MADKVLRQNAIWYNRRGQVAVEFLIMFILSASLLFYIFYFAISLSALQYQQYVTFMVGRAITSSSSTYADKSTRANAVLASFSGTDSSKLLVVSAPVCSINDSSTGFRNIMKYWGGNQTGLRYSTFSTAGIACNVQMSQVLPNILLGSKNNLTVAIESMTGSEISDDHCKCLINDYNNTWEDCLTSGGTANAVMIDNGC